MAKRHLAILLMAITTTLATFPSFGQGVTGRDGPKSGTELSVPLKPTGGDSRSAASCDYYDDPGIVSGIQRLFGPSEVLTSLERRGFRDIVLVRHHGATFVCEATAPHGERVRLVVNAHTGGIDGVRVMAPPRRRN
jgi:hypothetical protein